MSGCVNCVWDQYRDDLEEWAEARTEADRRLTPQNQRSSTAAHVAHSMDDDGGGSETNWDLASPVPLAGSELFADIPVGIREFMRTEKELKQRHVRRREAIST